MNHETGHEMPNVLRTMQKAWPVGNESLDLLRSRLIPCTFPRKHLLVRKDLFTGKAYFIEQGMTRSYWLAGGHETTTSFSTEGAIVFSMDELYYKAPSQEFVETLEEVHAFAITLDNLRELLATRLDLANWGRVIHQNEYRRLHRSHKERLTLPARQRYEAFSRQFPDVCRRASLGHIASYLGITPSTLSRLRATF